MGKPLHRHYIIPSTRCNPMMTQSSGDWRVCQQIVAEPWDEFQRAHPRYQPSYSNGLVAKRLACGNPAKLGDVAYRGLHGGQGKPVGSMRCQSSWGLRSAKVSVDHGVSQGSQGLHAGGISRHILRTVPAMCRTTFSQQAALLLRAWMRGGGPCLEDLVREGRGQALRGGSIVVPHTPGRHGHSHPPLPLLATRGGDDAPGERWDPVRYLPYEWRRRPCQGPRLRLVRQTRQTDVGHPWVARGGKPSPHGLVPNVHKGNVPSPSQSLATYGAQDVVSPPISVRRIDHADGERVP